MPSRISFWLFVLLLICVITESRAVTKINKTDLRRALGDVRTRSYHGFVILLRMMNAASYLQDSNVTFLMPDDGDISQLPISQRSLQDLVRRHTIPTALTMDDLLHFLNETLIPTSVQEKMMSITNTGSSGLYLNNARIVNPNVCHSSLISCHGINSQITYDVSSHSSMQQKIDRSSN